jgi:arylsulfatase A
MPAKGERSFAGRDGRPMALGGIGPRLRSLWLPTLAAAWLLLPVPLVAQSPPPPGTAGSLPGAVGTPGTLTASPQAARIKRRPTQGLPKRPPNIVYILADDLGYGDLGVQGSPVIQTPVLDKLAASGVRLPQFCMDGSICSPSRMAILTGRRPLRDGFQSALRYTSQRGIPTAVTTVAETLRDAGYATAHVGKWHIGEDLGPNCVEFLPPAVGFDSSARAVFGSSVTHWGVTLSVNEGATVVEAGHSTDVYTDYALDFLDSRAGSEQPFFLNLWYLAPHLPLQVPQQYLDLYPYDPTISQVIYAAMVTHMDAAIGRVLDKLDALGMADDTLVIFTSDNGGAMNLNLHPNGNGDLRDGKSTYFEGGIRVPFLARWPGVIPAGRVDESLVLGLDLLPTVRDLLELPPTDGEATGRSMLPALRAFGPYPRSENLYWGGRASSMAISPPSGILEAFAVRQDHAAIGGRDFKLVHDKDGNTGLFDLDLDPGELTGVSASYPAKRQELWDAYWTARRGTSEIAWSARAGGAVTPVGNAWQFNGGSLEIDVTAPFDFHDGSFTVLCTVRPMLNNGADQLLLGKQGSWELSLDAAGFVQLSVQGDGGSLAQLASLAPLPLGQAHSVAFTVQTWTSTLSDNSVRLYVDGVEQALGEVPAVAPNRNTLTLGNDALGVRPFFGLLADIEFHTVALLAEELTGGKPPIP